MINMIENMGKLYGIGVGPGDPELLTLKAVRTIQNCDLIAVPGKKKEDSVAYKIVKQIVKEIDFKECICIEMPMTKDEEILKQAHEAGAEQIRVFLMQGKSVGFLTLGDPTIYATYMYLHKRIQQKGFETEIINGIPSFCAVASRLNISLSEQDEQLHIIPASYEWEEAMQYKGNKIFMKAGKAFAKVKEKLEQYKENMEFFMVENCGFEIEKTYEKLEDMPNQAGYYTVIVAKEKQKK